MRFSSGASFLRHWPNSLRWVFECNTHLKEPVQAGGKRSRCVGDAAIGPFRCLLDRPHDRGSTWLKGLLSLWVESFLNMIIFTQPCSRGGKMCAWVCQMSYDLSFRATHVEGWPLRVQTRLSLGSVGALNLKYLYEFIRSSARDRQCCYDLLRNILLHQVHSAACCSLFLASAWRSLW